MYLNRADNYDLPTPDELRSGNIIMIMDFYAIVNEVKGDVIYAMPLLKIINKETQAREINEYPFDWVKGVDLRNWITGELHEKVLDFVFLSNDFVKTRPIAFNVQYTRSNDTVKSGGNWLVNGEPVSYLHEVMNRLSLQII